MVELGGKLGPDFEVAFSTGHDRCQMGRRSSYMYWNRQIASYKFRTLGVEPGTSCSLSANHTTRLHSLVYEFIGWLYNTSVAFNSFVRRPKLEILWSALGNLL